MHTFVPSLLPLSMALLSTSIYSPSLDHCFTVYARLPFANYFWTLINDKVISDGAWDIKIKDREGDGGAWMETDLLLTVNRSMNQSERGSIVFEVSRAPRRPFSSSIKTILFLHSLGQVRSCITSLWSMLLHNCIVLLE